MHSFDFAGCYHEGMVVRVIHPFIHSCIRSVDSDFAGYYHGFIHSFIYPITHAFVPWTVILQGVIMMEWILDSFIHLFIQSFMHSFSGQ